MRDQQLDPYLDRYTKAPLLTKADEERLGALVLAGRTAQAELEANSSHPEHRRLQRAIREGKSAQDQFIHSNTRLVIMVARRYGWSSLDIDDLVQEGILGLMHAAEKFDSSQGFRFSTYATWWIRQYISKAITRTGRTIRLPEREDDAVRNLARTRDDLLSELQREPTLSELAAATGASHETITTLLRTDEATLSLDHETGTGQGSGKYRHKATLADLIPDHSLDPQEVVLEDFTDWDQTDIGPLMATLAPEQQRVIGLRFSGQGMSQDAVAKHLGITRASVQSTERRAKANLRILAGKDVPYEHGTIAAHNAGCDCFLCRQAHNARQRQWRQARDARRRAVAVSA